MWSNYYCVNTVKEAVELLDRYGDKARIIAGGTDLVIELDRKIRTGIDTIIDISRIDDKKRITMDNNGYIHLSPNTTHNDCVASDLIREHGLPLAQAAWEVGSPQIRNRATVGGNLITASPANDTITPLMAMNAEVKLVSKRGERSVNLNDFYTGVRKTVMLPDEFMADIVFKAFKKSQRGVFLKLGLRKAQAISVINCAVVLDLEEIADGEFRVSNAVVTLGAVAPVIVHAVEAETYLNGKLLTDGVIREAARLATESAVPISDVRSSANYRKEMVNVLVRRALTRILNNDLDNIPATPVLLDLHKDMNGSISYQHNKTDTIRTRVNGKNYEVTVRTDKTLLDFLREDLKLTGTKEGCAEGECGACSVILDGMDVMSCLVPASRAHGAEITTIEGIATESGLHPVQQAFVEDGAVQCGYCTPGFIISSVVLLEENPHPTRDEIKQALTGNLCRCTGYYKIIEAVEHASQRIGE